jgi:hypothetical protein
LLLLVILFSLLLLVVLFSLLFLMVLLFTTYSWKHGELKRCGQKGSISHKRSIEDR